MSISREEIDSAKKLTEALSKLHDNTSDNETLSGSKPNPGGISPSRIAMAALPTTPLAFNRQDGLAAGIRLAGYGSAALLALKMKNKPLTYTFAAAAALSLATSLGATSWQ